MSDDLYTRTQQFLSDLLFMIGDSKKTPTEDDLMNVIIGFQTTLEFKRIEREQESRCD